MTDSFISRTAKISFCERYRWLLTRTWDKSLPLACVIMLNPSTADALIDDATIRALTRLLKVLGYGGFEVVNLFAWRATDPAFLADVCDPVGSMNDYYIGGALVRCSTVVCAWGAHKYVLQSKRGIEALKLLKDHERLPWCFGTTKAGAPKHPLYLKTGTPLEVYHG